MQAKDLSFVCELPPGPYFLGDPTTVLKDEIDFDNLLPGVYDVNHMSFAFNYTGFMEGSYNDVSSRHVTYKIENGIFGMVPYAFCNTTLLELYGKKEYYHDPVVFYSDGKGYFEILSTNYSYILDMRVDPLVLRQEEEDYDL